MTGLRTEILTRTDRLDALRTDWQALWNRTPDATPFQSPAWLMPWWRLFGNGRPRVVVLRDDRTLHAVLPAWCDGDGRIRLMGDDRPAVTDALVAPGMREGAADRLLDALDRRDDWTALRLRGLRPDGLIAGDAVRDPDAAPLRRISLPATLDDGVRARLAGLRLRADGRIGLRIETATPVSRDRLLGLLCGLHGVDDRAGDPAVGAFLRDAAAGLMALGLLRLSVVWLDHQPAAGVFAVAGRGGIWIVLAGDNPVHVRHAPLEIAFGHALEQAAVEGAGAATLLCDGPAGLGGTPVATAILAVRRTEAAAACRTLALIGDRQVTRPSSQ